MEQVYNEKNNCAGCGACKAVCPVDAIMMTYDYEGFLYPTIDQKKCVKCKKCASVCPIKNSEAKNDDILECYVAYGNDKIRNQSSSGGIFTILAEEVLKRGGMIVGATFDSEWNVEHICVNSASDMKSIRGSKYVQSRIEGTFNIVLSELNKGREVLFSGTACQIAGLKNFLPRQFDNLYTVDVLCHGVPSTTVWKKYLEEQNKRNISGIKNICFRSKNTGWKTYSVEIQYNDGKKYIREFFHDEYMKIFLSEIALRPSCYNCKFKSLQRESDITLGDAWGVEKHSPEMDDDKGTSVILIHSQKGNELFECVKTQMKYKKMQVDIALPPNADSRKSVKPHINRKKYLRKLKKDASFDVLMKCVQIGIIKKVIRKIKRTITK